MLPWFFLECVNVLGEHVNPYYACEFLLAPGDRWLPVLAETFGIESKKHTMSDSTPRPAITVGVMLGRQRILEWTGSWQKINLLNSISVLQAHKNCNQREPDLSVRDTTRQHDPTFDSWLHCSEYIKLFEISCMDTGSPYGRKIEGHTKTSKKKSKYIAQGDFAEATVQTRCRQSWEIYHSQTLT